MSSISIEIVSFDELIKSHATDQGKSRDLEMTKVAKKTELETAKGQAHLAYLEAHRELELAMVTPGKDVAKAVVDVEKKKKSYEFYEELYGKLFPNV